MKRNTAGYFFLGICVVLATLLLTRVITPIISASIFAVFLLIFGLFSRGFRKN